MKRTVIAFLIESQTKMKGNRTLMNAEGVMLVSSDPESTAYTETVVSACPESVLLTVLIASVENTATNSRTGSCSPLFSFHFLEFVPHRAFSY